MKVERGRPEMDSDPYARGSGRQVDMTVDPGFLGEEAQ
jgi:hypothetical protein